jgi:hypothetical protein
VGAALGEANSSTPMPRLAPVTMQACHSYAVGAEAVLEASFC